MTEERFSLTNVTVVCASALRQSRDNAISIVEFLNKHSSLPKLWAQLVAADSNNDVAEVSKLVREILELNASEWRTTQQQLEMLFRANSMHTWLVARRNGIPTRDQAGRYIDAQSDENIRVEKLDVEHRPTQYHLWLACHTRPFPAVLQLLAESVSYQENFDKLADAGFLTVLNDSKKQ